MPPPDLDLRSALDRFGVVVEFLKRDLEEMRKQVREEFVTRREYVALEERIDENKRLVDKAFDDLKRSTGERCVSKDEFLPVKNVVYGLVGMILMTVIGALLVLVIRGGGGTP